MNKAKHARRQAVSEIANVSAIEHDLVDALRTVREGLAAEEGAAEDVALAAVETFAAVALHVLKRCPPELIRHAAQVIEIRARMDGIPVLSVDHNPTENRSPT